MRIAGIDQGTTSTRVLIVNSEGELSVAYSVKHNQMYPQEGWVEHDTEELITNIQACANAAGKVDAIGLDNQGWAVRTGIPARAVCGWVCRWTINQNNWCNPSSKAWRSVPPR